jgi:hypothetical protein
MFHPFRVDCFGYLKAKKRLWFSQARRAFRLFSQRFSIGYLFSEFAAQRIIEFAVMVALGGGGGRKAGGIVAPRVTRHLG